MKIRVLYLLLVLGLISCETKSTEKTHLKKSSNQIEINSIKKIDIHAHFQYHRDYFPDLFKKWNLQSALIDVSTEKDNKINRSWNQYVQNAKTNPKLFYLGSSLIGNNIDSKDFIKNTIGQLQKEINQGAKIVKVWKNFGMVTKDQSGKFIQIDDERLQPIWNFLKSNNIPVMAHIGEPEQAWRILDPHSPHYDYYKDHPQYHAYAIPETPSYETIISARDNWIDKNPDLQILCAHMGSMSHSVDMIAERLDKFENILMEPAARFGDLASQDSKKVRDFFNKYQDRILFGTDYGNSKPQHKMNKLELEEEKKELISDYTRLWKYLSSTDSLVIRKQKTAGLGLSVKVLNKIYYQNAANLLRLE